MHFKDSFTNITATNTDKLTRLLAAGQSVTTLWLPGAGRTALISSLSQLVKPSNPDIHNGKSFQIIHLDLSLNQYYFEKQLQEVLEMHSDGKGIRDMLNNIAMAGSKVIFALDNFNFKDVELLKYIYSLKNVSQSEISFLILSLAKDFAAGNDIKEKDTLMSHNIMPIRYFNLEESLEWLTKNALKHSVSLSHSDKSQIYDFCGGIPALMRAVLRTLPTSKDLDSALASQEMSDVAITIWNHFNQREQHVIKSAFLHSKLPPYTPEIEYLKQHNLLNERNAITGHLWLKFVIKRQTITDLSLRGDQILYDSISIEEAFTTKEQSILKALLSRAKHVTRDEIARLLWKTDAAKKYSDWAIDQAISRIRKKLNKLGADSSALVSIKKKGFVIRKG